MSIELVISINHLILCYPLSCPQSFPASRSFPSLHQENAKMSQLFASGGQHIGASASASVLPVNIQSWFHLRLTGLIDLLVVQETLNSLLQHHSSKASILQHSAFFMVQFLHLYMTDRKTTALTMWTFVVKVVSLVFNMLSRLVIAFFPRSKHLLISWLQSPSAVILEPKKINSASISIYFPYLFAMKWWDQVPWS